MSLKTDVQKEFNKAIIRRDRQTCITCGSKQNLTASHLFSVGTTPNLRFYSGNVHTQCLTCHQKHERGEGDYFWFVIKIDKKYYKKLIELKNKVCKLYEPDLKQIKMLASRYEPNTATADNLEQINKIIEGGMK